MTYPDRSNLLLELERDQPVHTLAESLGQMWARGWQPRDIAQLIGVQNPVALALFVDQLSLDRQRWHRSADGVWREHADHLGAHDTPWWESGKPFWPQFIDRHRCSPQDARQAVLFNELIYCGGFDLPVFAHAPYFEAPHSTETDEGVLSRVRSLLAKAESTGFEHEADAFSAKAQQLITRYAIDVARLATEVDVPGGRRIYLDPPYTHPKFVLLSAVAQANTCRSVWNKSRQTATLIGYAHDIALTEMLFTSLLLKGTADAIGNAGQAARATNRTRSWRNAFWYGFAYRIGERLHSAAETARADTLAEHPERGELLPVLAARNDAVDRAFDTAFSVVGTLDVSVSNSDGLRAGRVFADQAELSADRSMGSDQPSALGR
ncbi:MAG: DUF2786 domain-containing protein [Acidimicrobiia bacterium]